MFFVMHLGGSAEPEGAFIRRNEPRGRYAYAEWQRHDASYRSFRDNAVGDLPQNESDGMHAVGGAATAMTSASRTCSAGHRDCGRPIAVVIPA